MRFGEDETADVGNVGKVKSGTGRGSKKAAPSFGGVAAMFGDNEEDEKPPSQIITKPKKPAGRQASFGGVAALFGVPYRFFSVHSVFIVFYLQ